MVIDVLRSKGKVRLLGAADRARYRAEIAKERSLRLKLVQRMLVSRTSVPRYVDLAQ